jgi:hypothetical protein
VLLSPILQRILSERQNKAGKIKNENKIRDNISSGHKFYFRDCHKIAKINGHLSINNMTDVQASDTEATLATMY